MSSETQIQLTLPDGSVRDYATGTTGLQVAESIGKGLAKAAVGIELDGEVQSLQLPIDASANIKIFTRDSAEGLEVLRHSAAHVLADAVKRIRPKAKLWKGPPVERSALRLLLRHRLRRRADHRRTICRSSSS